MAEFYSELAAAILKIVIAAIALVGSEIVLPWVKHTVIPYLKDKHLYEKICQYVGAAHKLAESGALPKADKKKYVVAMLAKIGVEVTPEVDAMIESAVNTLDLELANVWEEFTVETNTESTAEITEEAEG